MVEFGAAVAALKAGKRVTRAGWNGNGLFAYLVPPASYPVQTGAAKAHFGEGAMVPYRAYLALKTADDDVATWAPSASDVLAEDWFVLEEAAELGNLDQTEQPAPDLPPHQQRMVEEYRQLAERTDKLGGFIFGETFAGLEQAEQERLSAQLEHMTGYRDVLDQRLDAAGVHEHQTADRAFADR